MDNKCFQLEPLCFSSLRRYSTAGKESKKGYTGGEVGLLPNLNVYSVLVQCALNRNLIGRRCITNCV